jgi:hypothetical protein
LGDGHGDGDGQQTSEARRRHDRARREDQLEPDTARGFASRSAVSSRALRCERAVLCGMLRWCRARRSFFCEPFVIALVHRPHPRVEDARASAKFVNRGSVAINRDFSRHSGRWPVSVGIDLLPILASSNRTQGTALGRFREASVLAM